jgi:hypothetical protein
MKDMIQMCVQFITGGLAFWSAVLDESNNSGKVIVTIGILGLLSILILGDYRRYKNGR